MNIVATLLAALYVPLAILTYTQQTRIRALEREVATPRILVKGDCGEVKHRVKRVEELLSDLLGSKSTFERMTNERSGN
jgi:hypothetical protein